MRASARLFEETLKLRHIIVSAVYYIVVTGLLLAGLSAGASAECCKGRPMLVFSIDQGFPNGPVQNDDLISLQREIDYLKPFRQKFEVYALLAGDIGNKTYLQHALDLLAKNKMPFFLDAASSDAITLDAGTTAIDRAHGLELSIDELGQYKKRYGNLFSGIRLMELFEADWTIWASKFQGVDWALRFKKYWPQDDFYQSALIEPYLKFAASNNMTAIFADWFWYFDHQWAPAGLKQQQHETELQALMERYPNVVIALYDNNEPGQSDDAKWVPAFQGFLAHKARGFGLSDQAWMCADETQCPVDRLTTWAMAAFRSGAIMVQVEPYWYWWDFPRGEMGGNNYNQNKTAARGRATANLMTFASALGIDLTNINIGKGDNVGK